jgi:hypothetical protein
MSTVSWLGAISGNWSVPGNWSGDAVPGSGDTADIGPLAGDTAWIVTIHNEAVGSLQADLAPAPASAPTLGTLALSGSLAVAGDAVLFSGSLDAAPGSHISSESFSIGAPGKFSNFDDYTSLANASLSGTTVTTDGSISIGADAFGGPGPQVLDGAIGELDAASGSLVTAQDLSIWGGSLVSLDSTSAVVLGDGEVVGGAVAIGSNASVVSTVGTFDANVVDAGGITVQSVDGGDYASGGDLIITGSLTGGGSVSVDGAFDVFGPTVGTTLEVGSAAGITGDISLSFGATLVLDRGGAPSARLEVQGGTAGPGTVELKSLAYEKSRGITYDVKTGLLGIGGDTLNVGTGYSKADFTTARGVSDDTLLIDNPCYALGTRLATPAGEVPVEALRPGDMVLALVDGGWQPRPVRWVGCFTVDLARHKQPLHAAPIRICANAIADGVPHRDLLVSPDHALFCDGVLIQAQALVNGATILRDPARGRVTYLHVELDRHAIVLAERAPAESYLDTGNRGSFATEAGVRPLFPDLTAPCHPATETCVPLVLTGAQVEAAHSWLLHRALLLGHRITADPGLQLQADGCPVPLTRMAGGRWCALLPAGAGEVRLLSRSFVPEEFDPVANDRRRLGIAVAALRVGGRRLPRAALGGGWHAAEPAWRWTDGDATLGLRPHATAAPLMLRTLAAGPGYWQAPGQLISRAGARGSRFG